MALAQEDIDQIQWLIKKALSESPEIGNANVRYELDLSRSQAPAWECLPSSSA